MLVFLAVLILTLVIRGAKKTSSMQDYAVGSFAFSPVAVGLSLAAGMTSAATFIINPGLIGLYGYAGVLAYAVFLPLAAFTSLVVLTKKFRKVGTGVKALTLAQWLGKRYQSKAYTTFMAFLALLLITFIVLIVVGLAQLLSKTLDVSPFFVMYGIVAFVFGYMMFGGANSLIYTNSIQAVLMLVVAIILLLSGLHFFGNGFTGFTQSLLEIDANLVKATNKESFLFRNFFEIAFCQVVIGLAIVCQPHIITRSLILKSDAEVNTYLATGIITMIIFFSIVIVGLYARLTFPNFQWNGKAIKPDELISSYVVVRFGVGAALVVTLGLIAAGLSTLEALIQSLSTTVTNDILLENSSKLNALTDSAKILINRLVIIILAIVTTYFSYQQIKSPSLSVAIFAQNGVYAYFAAAFFPLIMGMFTKKTSVTAAVLASVTALTVHFSMYYGKIGPMMQNAVNNPAISATCAIILSSGVGILVLALHGKGSTLKTKLA